MFRISAEAKVHSTENPGKVLRALETILSGEVQERKIGNERYICIESKNHSALEKLYGLFRQQRILDVARKTLRKGVVGNSTIFYLNKQAAFVNKLNFCDEEGESPLGPIRVEIEYKNIDYLIDWLAPYTKNGSEVKLVKSFP